MLGYGLLVLVVGVLGYIRFAPSDPAVWHADMSVPGYQPRPNAAAFCPRPGDPLAPDMTDPAAILTRLDAIALATPRTARVAGSVAEGRITWITRTRLMGYPDYTTAQIMDPGSTPRLCIIGRQRFGEGDGGVNARRVQTWAQALLGSTGTPDLRPF